MSCLLSALKVRQLQTGREGVKTGGCCPQAPLPSPEMEKWILKKIKYLQSGGLSASHYNYKVRGRHLDLGLPNLPKLMLPAADLLLLNCFLC